jgi:hypothetical protein
MNCYEESLDSFRSSKTNEVVLPAGPDLLGLGVFVETVHKAQTGVGRVDRIKVASSSQVPP